MSGRPKVFVGIELDSRARAKCASIAERLRASGLDGRFEPPAKFHITLAFLGWIDAERVAEIELAMKAAAGALAPFTLALDRVGAFPDERRPRIVWIGSTEQGAAFRALSQSLRQSYAALGFSFDKHAVAHVTIARTKEPRKPLPMLDAIDPIPLHVTRIALFESLPDADTTRYEVISRAPLVPPLRE